MDRFRNKGVLKSLKSRDYFWAELFSLEPPELEKVFAQYQIVKKWKILTKIYAERAECTFCYGFPFFEKSILRNDVTVQVVRFIDTHANDPSLRRIFPGK